MADEDLYISINRFMQSHGRLSLFIAKAQKLISLLVLLSYPVFLIWCGLYHRDRLLKVVAIPLCCFFFVSLFRQLLGVPRPYERFDIVPLIEKDTQKKSFPSRHVFSIFMLAETYLYATTDAFAIPFYFAGLFLAASRVLLGVHYILDVFAGMMVALFCGVLYYIL